MLINGRREDLQKVRIAKGDALLEKFQRYESRIFKLETTVPMELSSNGSFDIDLTFNTITGQEYGSPYIELGFPEYLARLRVEIDIQKCQLTVNLSGDDSVLVSHVGFFDFSLLVNWRFWVTLNPEGIFDLSFAGISLCKMATGLRPSGSLDVSSNLSVAAAIRTNSEADQSRPVLDMGVGPMPLVLWPNIAKSQAEKISFSSHTGPIDVISIEEVTISNVRSCVIRLRCDVVSSVRVDSSEHSFILPDIKTLLVAEYILGHVAVYVPHCIGQVTTFWTAKSSLGRANSRTQLEVSSSCHASGARARRHFTSLPEIMRALYELGADGELTLDCSLETYQLHTLRVSFKLLAVIATILNGCDCDEGRLSIAETSMLIGLWSLAREPAYFARLNEDCPELLDILLRNVGVLGTKTTLPSNLGSSASVDPSTHEPSAHDEIVWSFQRKFARYLLPQIGLDLGTTGDLSSLLKALPSDVRDWAALSITEHALRIGLGEVVANEVSDDFIWARLNRPEATWEYTTLISILASKGEFGTCVSIIEGILAQKEKLDLSKLNTSSVALAFDAFCRHENDPELREMFLRSFVDYMELFEGREFSSFRNYDAQIAFIRFIGGANLDPYWVQDYLLDVITRHYGSTPEFWESAVSYLRDLPANSLFARIAEFAVQSRGLQRCFAGVTEGGGSSALIVPESIIATAPTYRKNYLGSVLSCHQMSLRGAASAGNTSAAWQLRLLTHPLLSQRLDVADVRKYEVRDLIKKLQGYPQVPHNRLLQDLGAAIVNGEKSKVEKYLQNCDPMKFAHDPATFSVLIDIISWWGTQVVDGSPYSDRCLNCMRAPEGETNEAHIQPSLHAALRRLAANGLGDLADQKSSRTPEDVCRVVDENAAVRLASTSLEVNNSEPESLFADTIVAVVTCEANLETNARECLNTWVLDARRLGARVIFFCGQRQIGSNFNHSLGEDVVFLPVGDYYEDLPDKMLAIYTWIQKNCRFSFVLKVDDDCYLDARGFFGSLVYRRAHYFGRPLVARSDSFDRAWHQDKARRPANQRSLDASPLGTNYADGGGCYSLSFEALQALLHVSRTEEGVQLRLASYFEDKLIGDLLTLAGYTLVSEGYASVQKRTNYPGGIPILQVDRTFNPSALSGIHIAHLNGPSEMRTIEREWDASELRPHRLFPLDQNPSLGFGSNMLEVLGSPSFDLLLNASHVCVCCFRNERKIVPHFLEHYRRLGINFFLIVDNLSDDGTREYLLAQDDVAVFSATSSYSASHYGVVWQRMILDNFCIGKWVVVADADEFLVIEGDEGFSIKDQTDDLTCKGFDAAVVAMVDMYPEGELEFADFSAGSPHDLAPMFDRFPVSYWPFNRGPFGNFASFVSNFRHRILPNSAPHMFTSQKVALFRYSPLMSFSEGFHFGAGCRQSPDPLAFLHFKYSSDFVFRAEEEVRRAEHFGSAVEYRKYQQIKREGVICFHDAAISVDIRQRTGSKLNHLIGYLRSKD